jgi:hypothetical protein
LVNADAFLLTNRGSEALFLGVRWGGENRRVYRWNFNPIFVSYLPYHTVSGVRNDEHRVLSLTLFGLKSKII